MIGTRVTEKKAISRCYSFPPHLTSALHYLRKSSKSEIAWF